MTIKKGTPTSVQSNGNWEGRYGVMFKHEITFDNGDCGEYSSKSENQNKFIVGQETSYEFIDGKFPKVKPHNPDFANNQFSNLNSPQRGTSKDELICRQNALTSAVRSLGEGCKAEEYIQRAEIFKQYTFDGKTPEALEELTKLPF